MLRLIDTKSLRFIMKEVEDYLDDWLSSSYEDKDTDYFQDREKLLEDIKDLKSCRLPERTILEPGKYTNTIYAMVPFVKIIYDEKLKKQSELQGEMRMCIDYLDQLYGSN